MKRIKDFFAAVGNWVFTGARFPLLLVLLIAAVTIVSIVVVTAVNKPDSKTVTAFVTVKGLGDGKDFENRQISITDGDSIADIFSLKYKNIYEDFEQPFIQYNEFQSLLGVKKTNEKSFHVTIDGVFDSNLSQAYVYGGQTVVISYY